MNNYSMTEEEINKKIEEYNNNDKKTIALFCDCFYPSIDGVISVVNNLAISLGEYLNVVVCVPKHKGKTWFKKEYLVIGAKSIKVPGMDYEVSLFPECDREFKGFLSKLKIDIIHIHSPFFLGKFAVKYAKKNNIPVVATFHSQYKKDFWGATHSHLLTKLLLNNVIKVFNKCELVFTMNKFCEDTFRGYGLKSPVKLIGNATNWTDKIDNNAILKVENKYNLNKYDNVWLFVGRLVKVKNLVMTIKVLNELKNAGINFIFICVGEGSQYKKLSKMVHKFGLDENVLFTGKIMDKEELEALYARAELFIFTSTYDCESIVGQEASIKGTPQVLVEGTGPASKIVDGENGFLCKNNVKAFADRIKSIIQDKDNLKTVGERAKSTIPLNWNSVAKLYKVEYDKKIKE